MVIRNGYDASGNRFSKQVGNTFNYYINGKDGNKEIINPGPLSDNVVINDNANGENTG